MVGTLDQSPVMTCPRTPPPTAPMTVPTVEPSVRTLPATPPAPAPTAVPHPVKARGNRRMNPAIPRRWAMLRWTEFSAVLLQMVMIVSSPIRVKDGRQRIQGRSFAPALGGSSS